MTLPNLKAGDRGHIAAHETLRSRVLCALDYPSIQAAIDAAKLAGRGEVCIPDGTYNVTQTIVCAAGVDLILSHGAILKAAADVDIVKVAPRGGIRGGQIDCSGLVFTKSAILIDGDLRFPLQPTMIRDIQLIGSNTMTGAGIRFQAIQQADFYPYIFGVSVSDFSMSNFGKGIWMEAQELTGSEQYASINANHFGNGFFTNCDYSIYMNFIEAQTNNLIGIGGNQFVNMQFQPADSKRALYCEGNVNMFTNLFVWDWQITGEQYAIELTARSRSNMVTTNLGAAYMTNAGTNNKIVTPDT